MENYNYTITYVGNGNFKVKFEDDDILKDAGTNICGMIRYTYFEDYKLPEIGWSVTNKKLLEDYFPKVQKDIKDGKILPGIINY